MEERSSCSCGPASSGAASSSSCCSGAQSSCCGPAPSLPDIPGYIRQHFVTAFLDTPAGSVPRVSTRLTGRDRLGAALVRLGIGRGAYRVSPGLYAVGAPGPQSPVLATANYKLTFDALRGELGGVDAWILVLDTKGVNVWCAAGKGTFGTRELAGRIACTRLPEVVAHRRVVIPQLGAPGVSGREVKRLTGFRVVFGPVRASDVPDYLAAGMKAGPDMRRVRFTARERVVVGLVEFFNERRAIPLAALALFLLAGIGADVFSLHRAWSGMWAGFASYATGFLAGNVLTPLLLPWLPGRAFSFKGAVAGGLAGLGMLPLGATLPMACGLWLLSVTAGSWYGMNFTGSSTYASPSGVEKEMRRAIPMQAVGLILSLALWRWGLGG